MNVYGRRKKSCFIVEFVSLCHVTCRHHDLGDSTAGNYGQTAKTCLGAHPLSGNSSLASRKYLTDATLPGNITHLLYWLARNSFFHSAVLYRLSNAVVHLQSNPDSGISNNVYTCALGLLTAVWSLVGYDCTVHMIEETQQADSTAGWPMLYALGLAAVSGLPFLLALTLCLHVSPSQHHCKAK